MGRAINLKSQVHEHPARRSFLTGTAAALSAPLIVPASKPLMVTIPNSTMMAVMLAAAGIQARPANVREHYAQATQRV